MKKLVSFVLLLITGETIESQQKIELVLPLGHTGWVKFVQFSPDSKYIVTTSADGTAKVWETITGKLLSNLYGHLHAVDYAEFSPDGKYILTGSQDNIAKIWDVATGKLFRILKGKTTLDDIGNGGITFSTGFSDDGKYVYTISNATMDDGFVKIWDVITGKLLRSLFLGYVHSTSAAFSPDGKYIVAVAGLRGDGDIIRTIVKCWDLRSGRAIKEFIIKDIEIDAVNFSTDGKKIETESPLEGIKVWDINTGKITGTENPAKIERSWDIIFKEKEPGDNGPDILELWEEPTRMLIKQFQGHIDEISDWEISPDSNFLVTAFYNGTAMIWDINTGRIQSILRNHTNLLKSAYFSPDGKYIVGYRKDSIKKILEISTGKQMPDFNVDNFRDTLELEPDTLEWEPDTLEREPELFETSPDGRYTVSGEITWKTDLEIWDEKTNKLHKTLRGHTSTIRSVHFSPDGKYILSASHDHTARIWETSTGKNVRTLIGHTASVNSAGFSPDGKKIVTTSEDYSTRIWDMNSGKLLYTFAFIDNEDYFAWQHIPGEMGYYTGTKNAIKYLSFRVGEKIFSFDQFDLQYNRPDKVLQSLGNMDTALIKTYENAWKKRLERAGFNEKDISSGFHVPAITLINKQVPPTSKQRYINLSFKASDSKYRLDRYYIYVNDVPINGVNGTSIKNLSARTFNKTITVELSSGINNIQISCRNEKGVEARSEMVYTRYQAAANSPSPKTWFIGIGVDKYVKSPCRNLEFAGKDILDLDSLFKAKDRSTVSKIRIDSLATRENILLLKGFLKNTAIDDRVVIALSGHGLRDSLRDFYFGTYDIDFSDPAKRGLKYEELEDLLDSIPARKRLLLIDACHSGELDTSGFSIGNLVREPKKPASLDTCGGNRRTGDTNDEGGIGLQNSIDVMKQLFADISGNNGTVVISAAKGFGFAEENEVWGNGAFTLCVKAAFDGDDRIQELNESADLDGDGVSINELKEYILTKVPLITKERQQPTTRRENLLFDWKVVNRQ